MSAPVTRDPLVVNTKDGVTWVRRAATQDGRGLYAVTDSCKCPPYLMATLVELAEHGIAGQADVLPMPVGPGPLPLTAEQRAAIADLIGDAKPANAKLLNAFGESVRDCREHEHPQASEDFHCLNLAAWMGERAGLVLRRLLDDEAENARLRSRVAELEGLLSESMAYAAGLEVQLAGVEKTPFSLDADTSADKLTRLAELEARDAALLSVMERVRGMSSGATDADGHPTKPGCSVWGLLSDLATVRGLNRAPEHNQWSGEPYPEVAPSQALPEDDVSPQVEKLRALLAGQRAEVEDPHDGPLRHDYRVSRDLPETGGTPC